MRALVLDSSTAGFDTLLERRRRSGLARLDEVWGGVLHMIPAPSLAHARIAQQLAELLGPLARDAGLECAMHEFNLGASEADFRVPDGALHRPGASGSWLGLADGSSYRELPRSALVALDVEGLAARIEWPFEGPDPPPPTHVQNS